MREDLKVDPMGAIVLENYLLVSDLHIGIEREVGLGRAANTEYMLKKLEILQDKYKVSRLVLMGDVKHRFDLRDIDLVRWFLWKANDRFNEIIILGGNHDKGINFINKTEIKILDSLEIGNYILTHGHDLKPQNKTLIIGHEHPVIELGNGFTSARYMCFLDFDDVIIMPAFNTISPGNDVLTYHFSSDYLNNKRWDAKVYISDETQIYFAGTLREIAVKLYGDIPEI